MAKFSVGDMVLLSLEREGEIKYYGQLDGESGDWYGIELTDGSSVGDNNGDWKGSPVFECEPSRGVFLRESDIRRKMKAKDFSKPKRRERLSMKSLHDIVEASTTSASGGGGGSSSDFVSLLKVVPDGDEDEDDMKAPFSFSPSTTTASPLGTMTPRTPSAVDSRLDTYSYDELMSICPFDVVGRGVAGIPELADYLDDSQVFFGLLQVEIGAGKFARYKNVFLHFNGESHPKPLQRAKANKKMHIAKEIVGHCHAPLTLTSKSQATVDHIFSQLKGIFVSDDIKGAGGKAKITDINSAKKDYTLRMEEAKKRAAQRQRELEEMERKAVEQAKLRRQQEAERRKREMEAEEERKRMERAQELKRKKEAELAQKRLEQEQARKKYEEEQKEAELKKAAIKKKKEAAAAKMKSTGVPSTPSGGKKRRKKRKKDDWSDSRPWTPERVVRCVHAPGSPYNWVILEPSKTELKTVKWGHGDLGTIRPFLEPDRVLYGLYRLSFGSGKFKRNHWVFFCWTPDSISTTGATMKERSKNNKKRMLHVSYRGDMERMLKPWNVAITAENMESVTIENWILRVQATVVVDGEELTKEAFLDALREEQETFAKLAAEQEAKARELAEQVRQEESAAGAAKREEARAARMRNHSDFQITKLKSKHSAGMELATPTVEEGFESDDPFPFDEEEIVVEKPAILDEEIPDEVEEVELSAEDIAIMEAERKAREEKERKRQAQLEKLEAQAMASRVVLESIELCKRVSHDLCWVLFKPRL